MARKSRRVDMMVGAIAFASSVFASEECLSGETGEVVYNKYCSVCHSVEPNRNKLGPSLSGVVGRKSASIRNYNYSEPMRALETTWTPEKLDQYLTSPGKMVPGTRMTFPGLPNENERKHLIAYLSTLSG